MNTMSTGERIRALRIQKGMSQEELGNRVGLKKAAINKYETGVVVNLKRSVIAKLADALQTSPAYLMGWEDVLPSNVIRMPKLNQVPLIGQIACGTPILAAQNIEDYVDLPAHIHADYALTCKGDSMIGAGVYDGDVVYIRQQAEVANGQIAAVIVDEGEATLKRFYHNGPTVSLVAENPAVAPLVYTGEDAARIRILGLAVAFTHPLV